MSACINDFVGIPWKKGGHDKCGADCWGLTTLVLREVYGVEVNEHIGSMACDEELSSIIDRETDSPRWYQPTIPRAGDVALMYARSTGRPSHIGVFVGDGAILHSPDDNRVERESRLSSIHPIRILRRLFLKIEFYRYDNNTA